MRGPVTCTVHSHRDQPRSVLTIDLRAAWRIWTELTLPSTPRVLTLGAVTVRAGAFGAAPAAAATLTLGDGWRSPALSGDAPLAS